MCGRSLWAVVGVVAVAAPWLVAAVAPGQQRYIVHVLIFTMLFAALALSYDLVVGHVGSLSLAHPAFFGVGAYTAAILSTRAGWPFVADLLAAVVLAGTVAALVGRATLPPRRAFLCRGHARLRASSPGSSPPTGWRSREAHSASPEFPSRLCACRAERWSPSRPFPRTTGSPSGGSWSSCCSTSA